MASNQDIWIGFFSGTMLMAIAQGLLLIGILVFHKRFSSRANRFLALAIMGICVVLFYEMFYWLEIDDQIPLIIQYLPIYIRTTIPVGIFFFVLNLIRPDHTIGNIERLAFLFIGSELIVELMYIPVNIFIDNEATIEIVEYWLILTSWFISVIAAILLIPTAFSHLSQYQKFLFDNYSTTYKSDLSWLRNLLLLILILMLFWIVCFIQYVLGYWEACEQTFSIVTIALMILLYIIGYSVIINNDWFQIVPTTDPASDGKQVKKRLSSNTDIYHQKLISIMENEKKYEQVDLTLKDLSTELEISSGYLSQIINEKEGKNFFEFINAYRVNAVKKKLLDKEFSNYTILGIALESGFNSKSTFNSVFKKLTGCSPSVYKKHYSLNADG